MEKITNDKYEKLIDVVPLTSIDSTFTYKFRNFSEGNFVGCRVLIPFASKKLTGVIVGEHKGSLGFPVDKLKSVIKLIDSKPIVTQKLIELCFWMANYYIAPIGDVFKTILPTKLVVREEVFVRLKNLPEYKDFVLTNNQKKIIDFLAKKSSPISLTSLKNSIKIKKLKDELDYLVRCNIVSASTRFSESRFQEKMLIINPEMFDPQKFEEYKEILKKRKNALSVLHFLYENFERNVLNVPLSTIKNYFKFSNLTKVLGLLEKSGFFELSYSENIGLEGPNEQIFGKRNELELSLSLEQENCVNSILPSIEKNEYKTFLIHGVTGSGKTLVYMHLLKRCIELGKSSIILVPEISLTPQLIERFHNAFPNRIAVLHSKLPPTERTKYWLSVLNSEKKIVIGARSAIFAPFRNLGLIIVDEEHEPTYKQSELSPRYNARDLALVRGKLENAVVVLGSATPSVSSYYFAKEKKYGLLNINKRADGAQMPKIEVVNILEERQKKTMYGQFSKILIEKILERIRKKEGVIIFQNRRGFGLILECRVCGYIPKCTHCDVSLTYHKIDRKLKCHYCGYEINFAGYCPNCGKPTLLVLGYGTQRIEEELKTYLNELGVHSIVERFDLDAVRGIVKQKEILKKFYDGEIDVLVGTQLIAKGLDFQRVTLVGIVNADLQINLPDYAANERAFQLFTQVAGRAGRKSDFPGEVIIQTSNPNQIPIKYFATNNYRNFFEEEIKTRIQLLYPPFVRLISLELLSKDVNNFPPAIELIKLHLGNVFGKDYFLGPITPIISRLKGLHRKVMLVKVRREFDPNLKQTNSILTKLKNEFTSKFSSQKVKLIIDVDSQFSLM
ncbi:MAG: primosomal protein N' [Ignavibacteria bacterium]|nr:primosomal protein N' [Ignavibacteria bacterium]